MTGFEMGVASVVMVFKLTEVAQRITVNSLSTAAQELCGGIFKRFRQFVEEYSCEFSILSIH